MKRRRRRRQYSAEWKARVALKAVKGQRTAQQIASHYEAHPGLVVQWKRRLLEGAAEMFSDGKHTPEVADEEPKAELYQQTGKLQVEVDWLKKKSGLSRQRSGGNGSKRT
ncbi:MAG TPA: transposase [Candidatus Acidoferrales bacterium]|nr:transposase [Candidatus Acidoferrales bacterium]